MTVLPLIIVYILLPEARLRPASAVFDKGLEDYLTQFGYLPASSGESMRTHLQVENALKNLQFFGKLNVTGLLDQDTINLMTKYVCNMNDVAELIADFLWK